MKTKLKKTINNQIKKRVKMKEKKYCDVIYNCNRCGEAVFFPYLLALYLI